MMRQTPRCAAILSTLLFLGLIPAVSAASPQQAFEVPPGIVMEKDLVYAQVGGRALRLDIFYPKGSSGIYPEVIFLHGERPGSRDKSHYWRMAALLASWDFVGVTIEYRTAREARYPAAVEDIKAALRWLRANATTYRVNPQKIGAVGENFGGYLAAFVGASAGVQAVAAIHPIVDLPSFAPPPDGYPYEFALFLGFPQVQRPDLWKEASPLSHVGKNSAPFLFLHGLADKSVPYQQSAQMMTALKKAGVQAEIFSPEEAGNAYFDAPETERRAAMRIRRFFSGILWEPPDNVVMEKDLVYARRGRRTLRLDLFSPKQGVGPFPGIVFVHGGGWMWGNKGEHRRQAADLAAKGFVTACIEYRLARERIYPAALDDVKAAVRWMRANATKYRIHPDRIGAAGSSAGGHLVALLGVTPEKSYVEEREPFPEVSARVQAVVAISAPVDMVEHWTSTAGTVYAPAIFLGSVPQENPSRWAEASPINHVGSEAPPFLFLHGTEDGLVSYSKAVEMANRLKAVGVLAELFTAEGGDHDFFWNDPWRLPARSKMEEFFIRVLKE